GGGRYVDASDRDRRGHTSGARHGVLNRIVPILLHVLAARATASRGRSRWSRCQLLWLTCSPLKQKTLVSTPRTKTCSWGPGVGHRNLWFYLTAKSPRCCGGFRVLLWLAVTSQPAPLWRICGGSARLVPRCRPASVCR